MAKKILYKGIGRACLQTWHEEKSNELKRGMERMMHKSSWSYIKIEQWYRREIWKTFLKDFSDVLSGLCIEWSRPVRRSYGKSLSTAIFFDIWAGICTGVTTSTANNLIKLNLYPFRVAKKIEGVWIIYEMPEEPFLCFYPDYYDFSFDSRINIMTIKGTRPHEDFTIYAGGHRIEELADIRL